MRLRHAAIETVSNKCAEQGLLQGTHVLNLEPTYAPSPLPAWAVDRRRLRSAQLGPSDGTGAEGLAVAAGRLHLSDCCADTGSVSCAGLSC